MKLFTTIMLALAVALSAAALAVSLMHAGPAGPRGTQGSQGAQGAQGPAGPQGPAGQDAPAAGYGYTCQMLFPRNGGTETTMYWPCTDNGNG